MIRILMVGLGGFIGSILRYAISGYVQDISRSISFPWGTIVVNITGCFVIGFLSQMADSRGLFSSDTRAFVFIGILGGFTTFSTFGSETMNLFRSGQNLFALANITAHVALCLAAVWFGRVLAHSIWR